MEQTDRVVAQTVSFTAPDLTMRQTGTDRTSRQMHGTNDQSADTDLVQALCGLLANLPGYGTTPDPRRSLLLDLALVAVGGPVPPVPDKALSERHD